MNNSAFNNQVLKTVKSAENSFQKGFSKVSKFIAAAFSIGAVVSFGKTCISVASQTESAWIGLKSIVDGQGKSFSRAKEFLNEYTKDGLIPLTNAVTAYKNLAARGYDDKQIQQTLTSLKDAAAFGRQASYSYGEAIQSATEGLKNENSILVDNAGVTKNVAKMWDDYAKSVGKTTNQLTQQEKITAEVNGILEETKFQVGDAAKYADTFAGRTARLSQTFYTLKNVIGEVIMPIANLFIPIIQKAMDKLVAFFSIIKQVMGALGLKSSSVLKETSSSFSNIGSSASNAANEAVKASKKMQRAIMPYDEINKLSKNDNSNISGTNSPTQGINNPSILPEQIEDTVSPRVQEIANKCSRIWKTLKQTALNAWDSGPVQAYVGFVSSKLKFTVELGKTLFTDLKDNIKTTWQNIEENIKISIDNISYLWTSYFETGMATIENYGPSIIQNISDLFNSIWYDAIDPFIQIASQMWSDFTTILVDLWNEHGQPLADNIGTFVDGITDTFNKLWKNIYEPIVKPFLGMVSDLWDKHLKGMIKEVGDFVLTTINSVLEIYNKVGKPIIDFLIEILGPIFSSTFNTIWNVIKTAVGFISDSIKNLMTYFKGIVNFVTGIFTGDWKKAWNGVKDIFKGVFSQFANIIKTPLNLVLDLVEGFINKIISGFNSIKKVINKFKIDVPDWLSDLTGMKTFGFNLKMSDSISLPRLATGGWVEPNKPRPVIVGDNKKEGEIIAPESKIYEQALKANEASGKNKNNKMVIDLRLHMDYPDGHYMIKEINDVQIEDGYISILT